MLSRVVAAGSSEAGDGDASLISQSASKASETETVDPCGAPAKDGAAKPANRSFSLSDFADVGDATKVLDAVLVAAGRCIFIFSGSTYAMTTTPSDKPMWLHTQRMEDG
jgi:hypothetical protein